MQIDDQFRDGNMRMTSTAAGVGVNDLKPMPSPPLAPSLFIDGWLTQANERRKAEPRPRTVIAFTGLAGSGKSTAAAHLVAAGWQRVRFAGPLKAMMAALGCTHAEIDGPLKEQPCALLGGKTPRHAMQTIGTEWGRDLISQDLWIRAWNAALSRVPPGVSVVVDDCRFPNEVDAVRAAGGVLVRIERPGAGTASVHSSEQHALPADAVLRNDHAPADLFAAVDGLVRDASWRDPMV